MLAEDSLLGSISDHLCLTSLPDGLVTEQQADHAHNGEAEGAEEKCVVWVENVFTPISLCEELLSANMSRQCIQ